MFALLPLPSCAPSDHHAFRHLWNPPSPRVFQVAVLITFLCATSLLGFILRRYGDIHAVTSPERLFSVFVQLIGACGIGIMLSNVTSLLSSLNAYTHALTVKLHEVLIAYWHSMPIDCCSNLMRVRCKYDNGIRLVRAIKAAWRVVWVFGRRGLPLAVVALELLCLPPVLSLWCWYLCRRT